MAPSGKRRTSSELWRASICISSPPSVRLSPTLAATRRPYCNPPDAVDRTGPKCREAFRELLTANVRRRIPATIGTERSTRPSADRKRLRSSSRVVQRVGGASGGQEPLSAKHVGHQLNPIVGTARMWAMCGLVNATGSSTRRLRAGVERHRGLRCPARRRRSGGACVAGVSAPACLPRRVFACVRWSPSSFALSCSPGSKQLACARPECGAPHHERSLAPEPELGEPHRGVELGECQHEREVGDRDERRDRQE